MADLLKRFSKAQERWQLWRSLHQEAFDYSAPERENFRFRSPGQRKNRHIFDSTAVQGLTQFASRMQGSLVPSWQQWMSYESGTDVPEDDRDRTDQLLEESTDVFFSELNHSNFSTEIAPTFSDLGIGTGAILVEESDFDNTDSVVTFQNVPLSELYPECPPGGAIESVWREQSVEPKQIKAIWPEAVLNDKLAEMAKKEGAEKVNLKVGHLKAKNEWHQVVIYEKHLVFTQSFDSKRLIVSRWHVMPGEVFGRGPILQVLPDIRTANKMSEYILRNAAIQISGIYTGVNDGQFNPHTVRLAPGSIIPVSSNSNQNPSLAPITPSGNIGFGYEELERRQDTIRKALFSDPMGEITDPVRSATEQMIRQQEMLKMAGAQLGRQKSELIEPLVRAVTDILKTRGKIPPFRVDGRDVAVRMTSPLAKSEGIENFQNSQLWFSTVASMLPQEVVAASVKIEELPRYWAEELGIPATLSRTDEDVAEIAQAAQQAAVAQVEGGR